jgi:hypothetical protein
VGQFLAISLIMTQMVDELVESDYKERMALAKKAVSAKTDEEVRQVMVEDSESEMWEEDPKQIEEEDVAAYRKKELPELRKFAEGTPSRTQYETKARAQIEEMGLAKYSFDFRTLIWISAGVAVAWKIVKPAENA